MIAPMNKFVLVILEKDKHKAPLHLCKLGIAHVERFQASGENCAALEAGLKKASMAKSILVSSKDKKTKNCSSSRTRRRKPGSAYRSNTTAASGNPGKQGYTRSAAQGSRAYHILGGFRIHSCSRTWKRKE